MTFEEYQEREIDEVFFWLAKSKFRSRFHLSDKDKNYVLKKGLDVIRQHAYDFVSHRLAMRDISNDGKQTPTATCCRGCLFKWHHIPMNKELSNDEINYVIRVIIKWIENEVKS